MANKGPDIYRCSFCQNRREGWAVNNGQDWLCYKCAGLPLNASATRYPETFPPK